MKKTMIRIFIIWIAMVISTTCIFSQTAFDNGFQEGFSEGYCHDQGVGCLSKLPPIPPIPKIGENSNSYRDGYNRGFKLGLSQRIKSEIPETQTRQRYKTTPSRFVDNKIYQPNYEIILLTLQVREATQGARESVFREQMKMIGEAFAEGRYNFVITAGSKLKDLTLITSSDLDYMLGASYYLTGRLRKADATLTQSQNRNHQPSKDLLSKIRKNRGKIYLSLYAGGEKEKGFDEIYYNAGLIVDLPVAYSKKWGVLTEFLYSTNGVTIINPDGEVEENYSGFINLSFYRRIFPNIKAIAGVYSAFNFKYETTAFGFATGTKIDVKKRIYIRAVYNLNFYEGFIQTDNLSNEIIWADNFIQLGVGVNLN